jgi:hypothetical protein
VIETLAFLLQMRRIDFARAVAPGTQFVHPFAIDVKTDHRRARPGECDCDRKPDVAKADNGYLALMRQSISLREVRLFSRMAA